LRREVPFEDRRIPLLGGLEQARGALDIGEEERDRPGREIAHP